MSNKIKIHSNNDDHVNPYLKSLGEAHSGQDKKKKSKRPVVPPRAYYKRRRFSLPLVLLAASFIFVLASVALSFVFADVKINITGKTAFLDIQETQEYKAYRTKQEGGLAFAIHEESVTETTTIKADKKEFVKQKASGKLVVYNSYSKKPIKIIKNTRFQTPDGKIYRAKNSFTLPGYTDQNGNKTPGKVEVLVFADEPGTNYNLKRGEERTKLKLPGLKNTQMYDSVWAELSTDITGGFIGEKPIISELTKENTINQLKQVAKQTLQEKLKNKFIIKNAIDYDYNISEEPEADSLKITLNAKAYAITFDETEFIEYLAKENNTNIDKGPKIIANKQEFTPTLIEKDKDTIKDATEIKFAIKGIARIKWVLDENEIKSTLSGKKIQDANIILSDIDGIKTFDINANILKSSFPTNPDKIKVEITFE